MAPRPRTAAGRARVDASRPAGGRWVRARRSDSTSGLQGVIDHTLVYLVGLHGTRLKAGWSRQEPGPPGRPVRRDDRVPGAPALARLALVLAVDPAALLHPEFVGETAIWRMDGTPPVTVGRPAVAVPSVRLIAGGRWAPRPSPWRCWMAPSSAGSAKRAA